MKIELIKNALFSPSTALQDIEEISLPSAAVLICAYTLAQSLTLFLTPSFMLNEIFSSDLSGCHPVTFFIVSFVFGTIITILSIPLVLWFIFFISSCSIKKIIFSFFAFIIFLLILFSIKSPYISILIAAAPLIAYIAVKDSKRELVSVLKINAAFAFIFIPYLFLWAVSIALSNSNLLMAAQFIHGIWTMIYFCSVTAARLNVKIPSVFAAFIFSSIYIISSLYLMRASGLISTEILNLVIMQA